MRPGDQTDSRPLTATAAAVSADIGSREVLAQAVVRSLLAATMLLIGEVLWLEDRALVAAPQRLLSLFAQLTTLVAAGEVVVALLWSLARLIAPLRTAWAFTLVMLAPLAVAGHSLFSGNAIREVAGVQLCSDESVFLTESRGAGEATIDTGCAARELAPETWLQEAGLAGAQRLKTESWFRFGDGERRRADIIAWRKHLDARRGTLLPRRRNRRRCPQKSRRTSRRRPRRSRARRRRRRGRRAAKLTPPTKTHPLVLALPPPAPAPRWQPVARCESGHGSAA